MWYVNNRDYQQAKTIQNKKLNRVKIERLIVDHLRSHPCVDCGETNLLVLDFDHVDRTTKLRSLSASISAGLTTRKVLAEIEKCVIRCANCHRKRTAQQFNWWKLKYVSVAEGIG